MSFTVQIDSPYYTFSGGASGVSATIEVDRLAIQADFEAPSECIFLVNTAQVPALYTDEDNLLNPLMVNSRVLITYNAQRVFEGFIIEKPCVKKFDEGQFLTVTCLDKAGFLLKALCPHNSAYEWIMESDAYHLVDIDLEWTDKYASSSTITVFSLWPDPNADPPYGDKAYIRDVDSPQDTLGANIADPHAGPFDIELSNVENVSFAGRGWVKIDSEWFYYDGYGPDPVSGNYTLRDCHGSQLGTGSAAHLAGATAYRKIAKQIAVARTVELTANSKRINADSYTVDPNEGCFKSAQGDTVGTKFGRDSDGDKGSPAFTGDYYIYDEDQQLDPTSDVKYVSDVWATIITADGDEGGADFDSGDYWILDNRLQVTELLAINRYDYNVDDKPAHAWDAIQELITSSGLTDDILGQELVCYYDHTNDKMTLELLAQAVLADINFSDVDRVEDEVQLRDLVNGILVRFTEEVSGNVLEIDYAWHDTAANEGVDSWKYVSTSSPELWKVSEDGSGVGAGNTGLEYCIDGNLYSKFWAVKQAADPSPFVHSYWWFGSGAVPPTIILDEMSISVGGYNYGNGRVVIEGATDFNSTTHQSATNTWHTLMELNFSARNHDGVASASKSEFAVAAVNCVRISWEECPSDVVGKNWHAHVHEFRVEGHQSNARNYYVQTTDAAASEDGRGTLYPGNTNTHKKLRGGSWRFPARADVLDIGPSSQGAAISFGRLELQNRLKWYQQRYYEYKGAFPATKPELGMTIEVDEDGDGVADYTGILRGYRMEAISANVIWQLRILDYNATEVQ